MKIILNYAKIVSIGVDNVASNNLSTKLCNYVITSQQNDLFIIFENFSDNVSDPTDNIFFIQNEILDRILTNIEECKKDTITKAALYKGINEKERNLIKSLDLDHKLAHNAMHCKIIGVDFFDESKFMNILQGELKHISTKYNLNADDDYNKLYKFLTSIHLTLQSSDDALNTLSNQYVFFNEHSKYSNKNCEDEFITIYGDKIYKIDILKTLLEKYNSEIQISINKPVNKGRK